MNDNIYKGKIFFANGDDRHFYKDGVEVRITPAVEAEISQMLKEFIKELEFEPSRFQKFLQKIFKK
jgi:hypothetical protein